MPANASDSLECNSIRALRENIDTRLQIISAVCQHWWTVILGGHILWTDIRTPYCSLSPILLERSGVAPLSFTLLALRMYPKKFIRNTLEAVSEQWHGVKSLNFALNHSVKHTFLLNPAPKLMHLSL
ncbi:hypothetical protein AX16_005823 [Volvariella volvacea WC 439]|nr:hypothetical protein AX16_005823 [Volvariella volvacea WC 439]